jgi:transposase-like protein
MRNWMTPTEVARKHGISSGLLYGWRQKLIGGRMTLLQQSPPGFARVEIAPAHSDKHDPEPAPPTAPSAPEVSVQRPAGLIEILLHENVTLRVDSRVDGQALRRVGANRQLTTSPVIAVSLTQRYGTIAEIARAYRIAEAHLIKVVHQLGVSGHIETLRGRNGAMRLAKPTANLTFV